MSAGTVFTGNIFGASQLFTLTGSAAEPSSIAVHGTAAPVTVSVDQFSKADFGDATGQLVTAGSLSTPTTVAASGSDLALTSAMVGTLAVPVTAQPYGVLPSIGTATASGTTVNGVPNITVAGVTAGQSLAITAANLTPGGTYLARRGTAVLGVFYGDSTGAVRFSDTPGVKASVVYTVATH
jgi:hypothetical protein